MTFQYFKFITLIHLEFITRTDQILSLYGFECLSIIYLNTCVTFIHLTCHNCLLNSICSGILLKFVFVLYLACLVKQGQTTLQLQHSNMLYYLLRPAVYPLSLCNPYSVIFLAGLFVLSREHFKKWEELQKISGRTGKPEKEIISFWWYFFLFQNTVYFPFFLIFVFVAYISSWCYWWNILKAILLNLC